VGVAVAVGDGVGDGVDVGAIQFHDAV
jgi:hypothetical protein